MHQELILKFHFHAYKNKTMLMYKVKYKYFNYSATSEGFAGNIFTTQRPQRTLREIFLLFMKIHSPEAGILEEFFLLHKLKIAGYHFLDQLGETMLGFPVE